MHLSKAVVFVSKLGKVAYNFQTQNSVKPAFSVLL